MNSIIKFNRKDCYGCGVCVAACPRDAIQMRLNADGFYSPILDSSKCVHCGV